MKVLIEPIQGGYRARTPAPWDAAAEGQTEGEALNRLRDELMERIRSGARVVDLDLPASEGQSVSDENPWLAVAGVLRDDPDYDAWRAEMDAYRRERDQEEADGDPAP